MRFQCPDCGECRNRPLGSAAAQNVLLLLLAIGAEPVLRQHRLRLTELFDVPRRIQDHRPRLLALVLLPLKLGAQTADLHAQRVDGRALAGIHAGGILQLPQPVRLRRQPKRIIHSPAGLLRPHPGRIPASPGPSRGAPCRCKPCSGHRPLPGEAPRSAPRPSPRACDHSRRDPSSRSKKSGLQSSPVLG